MKYGEAPAPKLHAVAPTGPRYTQSQLDEHVTTLLELTQLDQFKGDPTAQGKAFVAMQDLWGQLSPEHRSNVRARVCEALHITGPRFDYLITTDDASDLYLGLRFTPTTFSRVTDERIYPDATDGWLGNYLAYAQVGEAHVGWHFWSALVILAAACRRNFYLLGGHKRIFPNLYVLLEGASGSGKNTAIERAQNMLTFMNKALLKRHALNPTMAPTIEMLSGKMTPPKLLKGLAGTTGRPGLRQVDPLRTASDIPADYESVATIIAPEAATLLSRDQFGVDQLIVLLTQAYDGWLEDDTDKRGRMHIANVALSLLLGSTMSWLRENITATVFQGGFMGARCLMIPKTPTNRSYPDEPLIDPIERMSLAEALCTYAEHPPTEMVVSPEAQDYYIHWYETRPRYSEDDRIAGYYGRKRVYIKKLAMLYALSRGHVPTITLPDMVDAVMLLGWEEPAMVEGFRQVLAPTAATDREFILDCIGAAGGALRRDALASKTAMRLTNREFQDVMAGLQTEGKILHRKTAKALHGKGGHLVYYRVDMQDSEGNRILKLGGPRGG